MEGRNQTQQAKKGCGERLYLARTRKPLHLAVEEKKG